MPKELAIRLGIPMYAADPDYVAFGTKSAGRRMFAEDGVPRPLGIENLCSIEDLIAASAKMRTDRAHPSPDGSAGAASVDFQGSGLRHIIVKLNKRISGEGYAVANLEGLPHPGHSSEPVAILERLLAMRFELAGIDFDWYAKKLEERGGVGELGRLGFTAISDSREEADALYKQMTEVLDAEDWAASPLLQAYSAPLRLPYDELSSPRLMSPTLSGMRTAPPMLPRKDTCGHILRDFWAHARYISNRHSERP